MAKIEIIEDLIIWQIGIELTNDIYSITQNEKFNKDFALKDQIRKSAISIPSNVAEGFERNSNNQFVYFLVIAKGSAGELKTQLLIAKNQGYISQQEFEKLHKDVTELGKKIGSFISYLKTNKTIKLANPSTR